MKYDEEIWECLTPNKFLYASEQKIKKPCFSQSVLNTQNKKNNGCILLNSYLCLLLRLCLSWLKFSSKVISYFKEDSSMHNLIHSVICVDFATQFRSFLNKKKKTQINRRSKSIRFRMIMLFITNYHLILGTVPWGDINYKSMEQNAGSIEKSIDFLVNPKNWMTY
jgi:hypothetical protein